MEPFVRQVLLLCITKIRVLRKLKKKKAHLNLWVEPNTQLRRSLQRVPHGYPYSEDLTNFWTKLIFRPKIEMSGSGFSVYGKIFLLKFFVSVLVIFVCEAIPSKRRNNNWPKKFFHKLIHYFSVGNATYQTTEQELGDYFSTVGQVTNVR